MIDTFLIAFALAMDCFAVSVVCGVIVQKKDTMWALAFFFGLFQTLMPLIGWFGTSRFSQYLEAVDHWIAFAMLALIGGKMVWDAFHEEKEPSLNPRSLGTQLLLAVATSIDAMAVGISYACTGYERLSQLWYPLAAIGGVSFLMSVAGFLLGLRFGPVVNKRLRPELLGGLILICIGLKILFEHLCA